MAKSNLMSVLVHWQLCRMAKQDMNLLQFITQSDAHMFRIVAKHMSAIVSRHSLVPACGLNCIHLRQMQEFVDSMEKRIKEFPPQNHHGCLGAAGVEDGGQLQC